MINLLADEAPLRGLQFDVIVVGSGIAGLTAALRASRRGSVALVTKDALYESNTFYAQGGIAAVLFDDDAVDLHVSDTLAAAAGLGEARAIEILCSEGSARVRELIDLGIAFDRNGDALARGLEAAHSRKRIVHAGGDATGKIVELGLAAAVQNAGIGIFEHHFLQDLIMRNGAIAGVALLDQRDQPVILRATSVVLASGGAGQLFRHTTNPEIATGDGVAAALRAGAVVRDAEFYQFHPTALAGPESFLISEAVRGEGAVLRNQAGARFLAEHPQAELAPRDVVARAIAVQMQQQDGAPVWLDATAFDAEFLARRFPSIDVRVRDAGIAWDREFVPITPAAHYWMGGVATDVDGRTTVAGLYAVGEVANTGVHGANRLASNSLLEGLVFAARAVDAIVERRDTPFTAEAITIGQPEASGSITKSEVQDTLWDNAGLVRDAEGLRVAAKTLEVRLPAASGRKEQELQNLATIGRLLVAGAQERTESRGAHYRSDFPLSSEQWRRHLSYRLEA